MTYACSLQVDTGFGKQNYDIGFTELKFVAVALFQLFIFSSDLLLSKSVLQLVSNPVGSQTLYIPLREKGTGGRGLSTRDIAGIFFFRALLSRMSS